MNSMSDIFKLGSIQNAELKFIVLQGRLSAQHVGSIVSSRVQEIAETSQHYSQLHQQITVRTTATTTSLLWEVV